MTTLSIDEYSMATLPTAILYDKTQLAEATSFVWQNSKGRNLLVTNWHNVTGIDPHTGVKKAPSAPAPNNLIVMVCPENAPVEKHGIKLHIRDADDNPIWRVHPKYGRAVDVVVIPLPEIPGYTLFPINRMHQQDILVQIGSEVFILGYPFGLTTHGMPPWTGGLPIWKKASVASEPGLSPTDRLDILVDTASRPGMSGSPVVARQVGSYVNPNRELKLVAGHVTDFVGVYSGRVIDPKDKFDIQLGRVWPRVLLEEIAEGGVLDLAQNGS